MKITAKTSYGLRTLVEIALHTNQGGIYQKDIAQSQEISNKYLDQIIAALKTSGLIVNSGGKKSGYILSKSASAISLYDIYRAFESELSIVDCSQNQPKSAQNKDCASRQFWCELNSVIIQKMESQKLSALVEQQRQINERDQNQEMYFI